MALSSSMAVSATFLSGNPGLTSFNHVVNAKLDAENYVIWKSQVLPTLRGLNLVGFIEGTSICPSEYVLVDVGTTTTTPIATMPATTPVADGTVNQVETTNPTPPNTTTDSTASYAINPQHLLWIRQDQSITLELAIVHFKTTYNGGVEFCVK
ncbi:hypothetical protein LIER_37195 [Lithospermum erythrorhizon]|uniref:Retrotransposon Copia-like N-terminal domain-containing protein n=1 Tax=Lithospermum erythrorhizon TaxID=34254 RepID=A0AAV3PJ18_LITER